MRVESDPVVSVVIPTRDRLTLLREAVNSVVTQSFQPCEAIVVDDASSDGTPEWLRIQDPTRVVPVRLNDPGERAVARNRGLDRARGDYVLFLDDDDRLTTSALQHLHAALRARPECVGAVGARLLFNDTGDQKALPHPRRTFERSVWLDLLAGWMSPPGTVLWRTDVVRSVGGWDPAVVFSGDKELFLRMSRRRPVVVIPHLVLEKRAHAAQRQAPRSERLLLTQRYIDALPPADRGNANVAFAACRQWNDARIAYGELRAHDAVVLYAKAIRTAPFLIGSPLLRRTILTGMGKALVGLIVGGAAVQRARRAKQQLLRAVRRDVQEIKREESRP